MGQIIRAGVFIGVDQTGGLRRLKDAAKGAARMHAWALQQGMPDGTHAKLITDAAEKVTREQIFAAIKAINEGAGADQLIVYFAGHGVNIGYNEKWLLSDAPDDSGAAVDVGVSVERAFYGAFQHVVFISDACRVAPEGIQAQSVRGDSVFPSVALAGKARSVDRFFACTLGDTAAEVRDPRSAADNFSALYTTALLDAFTGVRPDVLEPGEDPGDAFRYVRPRRLKRYLEGEIVAQIRARGLLGKVNQEPDAIIVSDDSWLARVKQAVAGPAPGLPGLPADFGEPGPPAPPSNLGRLSEDLVNVAVGAAERLPAQLDWARAAPAPGAAALVDTAEKIAAPFGPDHFETECGIKVRGARMVDAFATRAHLDRIAPGGEVLRVNHVDGPAASAVVTFDGGYGTLVPCIPGFIAGLTMQGDELIDVAYEPSRPAAPAAEPASTLRWKQDLRWQLYQRSANEIRALRGVAASSAQRGRFRLAAEGAEALARKMQYAKGIDPTMAVYAAYAYYDLQAIERIEEMSRFLREDLGFRFFDVELLARKLVRNHVGAAFPVVPFVPLLTQGWPLVRAHQIRLHPELGGIEDTMRDSLWSLFDLTGVAKLRNALQTKEVR